MIKCYQNKGWDLNELLSKIEINPSKIINIEHTSVKVEQRNDSDMEEEYNDYTNSHSIYYHIFVYYYE